MKFLMQINIVSLSLMFSIQYNHNKAVQGYTNTEYRKLLHVVPNNPKS